MCVLMLGGLLPRSRLLGPNWTRLPDGEGRVALTIDDGPDPEVTPAVLDLLARHGVRATFFCIGERVARHPQLARRIAARATRSAITPSIIATHSRCSVRAAMRREIAQAQASIRAVCQVVPRFFRAPAGLRNPFLQPCLAELGLQLASWTRRGYDTVNADADAGIAAADAQPRGRGISCCCMMVAPPTRPMARRSSSRYCQDCWQSWHDDACAASHCPKDYRPRDLEGRGRSATKGTMHHDLGWSLSG